MPNDQSTRAGGSRRLTVLSDVVRAALYDLPDLDDFQRGEFFALTDAERGLAERRGGPNQRLHCLVQIGYFKAKHAFFIFGERDIPAEDIDFLRKRGRVPAGGVAFFGGFVL